MYKVFGHLCHSLQKYLSTFSNFILELCTSSRNFILMTLFYLEHLSPTWNCFFPQQVITWWLSHPQGCTLCPQGHRLNSGVRPASLVITATGTNTRGSDVSLGPPAPQTTSLPLPPGPCVLMLSLGFPGSPPWCIYQDSSAMFHSPKWVIFFFFSTFLQLLSF